MLISNKPNQPFTPVGDEDAFVGERTLRETLEKTLAKCRYFREAHYAASVRMRRNHYRIGIPAVVLSAVVGTTVFGALEHTLHLGIRIAVGAVSVGVAVLTAIQTFLRFGERAEAHRVASAKYESLSNEIRLLMAVPPNDVEEKGPELVRRVGDLFFEAPELADIDRLAAKDPSLSPSYKAYKQARK